MSDSTTQQQKRGKAGAGSEKPKIEEPADGNHPFARELYKKIRNNEKKLKDIKELEEKVKSVAGFVANEEQKKKMARREVLEKEIGEMNHYVEMFRATMKEEDKNKKDQQVRHQKEISLAKKQTIRAITNLITLHALKECGQGVPREIDEALEVFSESFNKILNKGQPQFHWRASRDEFVDTLTRLHVPSKDKIGRTDISPDELDEQIAGLITSGTYPETIESPVAPSGAVEHGEAKQSAPAKEAQQEVDNEDEDNAGEAAQEEDNQQDEYDEEAQQEGNQVDGNQAEAHPVEQDPAIVELQKGPAEEHKGQADPAGQNPDAENNQAERRGGRGNKRRGGNDRGNRERGDDGGRGDRGDRGDRGERRGRRERGRPHTARGGEDPEGFTTVEGDGKSRGGRGRGGRGSRGYYNNNNYRGGRGARGDRGGRGGPNQENGGFSKRGDRAPRARGGRGNAPGEENAQHAPPADRPAEEQKQANVNNASAAE